MYLPYFKKEILKSLANYLSFEQLGRGPFLFRHGIFVIYMQVQIRRQFGDNFGLFFGIQNISEAISITKSTY